MYACMQYAIYRIHSSLSTVTSNSMVIGHIPWIATNAMLLHQIA